MYDQKNKKIKFFPVDTVMMDDRPLWDMDTASSAPFLTATITASLSATLIALLLSRSLSR
jgi:hypothetical protein